MLPILEQRSESAVMTITNLRIWFLLILVTAGCSSASREAAMWRASVDNGDKPGIGIELTRHAGALSGRMLLLDPNRPHDFGAGRPFPMQIRQSTETEIRFAVAWPPTLHEELILKLNSPLGSSGVRGTLSDADGTGRSEEYEFTQTR